MIAAPRAGVVAVLLAALLSTAGCSSSSKPSTRSKSSTASTTSAATQRRAQLEFREVEHFRDSGGPLVYPFSEKFSRGSGPATSCKQLIAANPPDIAKAPQVVLPDRKRAFCYIVGPPLVTGASVASSSVVYDSTSSQWAVNVHFANDDFLHFIARPLINYEVAIVLDGIVQSAPRINPGITGRDVEITGGFTKAEATKIAASITGVAPSAVHVALPDG